VLRVAISIPVVPNRGIGGMETTVAALVHSLGRLAGPEEFVLIGNRLNARWLQSLAGHNQKVVIAPKLRLTERVYLSVDCDIVHLPIPPKRFIPFGKKMVYTVHDLLYRRHPEFYNPGPAAVLENAYRAACARATVIIAISQCVKEDLIREYSISPERITVIPWGPPTAIRPKPTPDLVKAVKAKYGLNLPFAFYPAMVHPHKNHLGLVEAIGILRDQRGLKVRVVCTGAPHQHGSWIKDRISALHLDDQVIFLGLVPSEHIRAIYRAADFVIFPSLSEGAGVPLLEAWLEDVPVACSNVAALAENAGDAALKFDPTDTQAIASALSQMTTDPLLRDELRQRGAKRLDLFNWDQVARAYREAYYRAWRPESGLIGARMPRVSSV